MHWTADVGGALGEHSMRMLARWWGGARPAAPEWDRIRPTSRALPGSWDATRHPWGEVLLDALLPCVEAAVGAEIWSVVSNLRICERGASVPMHCDIAPRADLALFFDLAPLDHAWPFLVERDAGGSVELLTCRGRGVIVETHRTRHGRRGPLAIERSVGAILRYSRDPSTSGGAGWYRGRPGAALTPLEVSRLDARGWHETGIDDLPEQPFGTGGPGFRELLESVLGAPVAHHEYRVVRPGDGAAELRGAALCVAVLGTPVRGGAVRCGAVEGRYGDIVRGEAATVDPVISGEQRLFVCYASPTSRRPRAAAAS